MNSNGRTDRFSARAALVECARMCHPLARLSLGLAILLVFATGCGAVSVDPGNPDGRVPADTRVIPDGAVTCTAPNGQRLLVGESAYDGCNTCSCLAGGSLACTGLACPDRDAGTTCSSPDGRTFLPGQTYDDGCNTCYCNNDGRILCTQRACLDAGFDAPPQVCTTSDGISYPVGGSYYDGCNTCYCGANGLFSCTIRFCVDAGLDVPTPIDVPIPRDVQPPRDASVDVQPFDAGTCIAPDGTRIVEGQLWTNGCTDCVCANGAPLCRTNSLCTDAAIDVPPVVTCNAPNGQILQVGEVWSQGCLGCYCQPSGAIICATICTVDAGTPRYCSTSNQCFSGEQCTGPAGCGIPWTCQRSTGCTADYTPFCSCDGRTTQWGSSSCPPGPYAFRGVCPPSVDAGIVDSGTTRPLCDPRAVMCRQAPPSCPFGLVPQVVNGCWGGCVGWGLCLPIPCSNATPVSGCPSGMFCTSSGVCSGPNF